MQVTETLNEGLKRGYQIVVSAAELEEKVNTKLAEAQPEVEMKGFRKGKVPMSLMKRQFGQQVLGEAMQESVDGAMQEHFEASGDRPAMQPEVKMTNEDWKEGDDVEVTLSYEALPDVPEADLKKVKVERMVVEVTDADIDEALKNLAENANNFEDRKKGSKAKDGDQVVMSFVGKVDGEAFEGGSAEDFPLVLGSGSFIPGFEEQLVGVKAGDTKEANVTFPADYGAEHLAGKDAVFECEIKSVQEPKPAEIDDELAKKFGAEDLDALKTQLKERLEQEYAGAARQVTKRGLLDQLDTAVAFDLPPSLVESEANSIAHQLWHDDNPDHQGHDHPEIEPTEEHTKLAERRVRLGLYLNDLGGKNDITVSEEELRQAMMTEARRYPGQEAEFFKAVQENPQFQQQLRAPIFEEKVVDYILELASVTDKPVSKDDLQKALDELSEG